MNTLRGKDHFLRISIDKEGGVNLNDCTLASEKSAKAMDENDPIPDMYYLDVASPGAERPIKKKKIITMQLINQYLYHYMRQLKAIKSGLEF